MSAVDLSDELRGCDFGDQRLIKRACRVINILGQKLNISIPAAFLTRAETEACYRLMDNENVSPEKILQPHIEATYQRIEQTDYVVLVQGTTELDLTRPQQQVEGAGLLSSHGGVQLSRSCVGISWAKALDSRIAQQIASGERG